MIIYIIYKNKNTKLEQIKDVTLRDCRTPFFIQNNHEVSQPFSSFICDWMIILFKGNR